MTHLLVLAFSILSIAAECIGYLGFMSAYSKEYIEVTYNSDPEEFSRLVIEKIGITEDDISPE